MAGPNDILDYASPRPRGRYRLPSVSRLDVQREWDSLVVIETLRGKGAAIAAMLIGLVSLITLPCSFINTTMPGIVRLWQDLSDDQSRARALLGMAIFLALWGSDAVLLVLVANNTWRKTVLEVRDGTLTLTLQSLFGRQVHNWPFEQILELGVDRTLELEFIDPRLELVLRAHGGQLIHLFADHKEAELEPIAAGLKQTMGWTNVG